ncbi:MAG: SH3 domain-containing protein [Bacteroidales bacterium]|nr:SH3 domain-containing protein [Bacteroidales bacterium]
MTIKQISLATLLTISPLISFGIDYYGATTDLNVRTGAGTEYSVSFTLQKGDEVEVLSKNGSWYKIKYLGKIGYAHSKYLKSISDTKINTSQQSNINNSALGILLILGVIGFFWLVPILIIFGSSKTTFGEKIAWVLAVLFISWFAWIFYILLAPIKKKD